MLGGNGISDEFGGRAPPGQPRGGQHLRGHPRRACADPRPCNHRHRRVQLKARPRLRFSPFDGDCTSCKTIFPLPPALSGAPTQRWSKRANLTRFMRALGVDSFEALNERASLDPSWFHDELIRFLDYRFERPYERVLDVSEGLPFARWCVGGVTNVVLNCLDRRRGTDRYGQPALVWEGEDGAVSTWTFADLDRETCRLAWGLRSLGIGRGDVVGMYLPNLPHAAAAMLAVAKIGAIVLPMFSGFGADAITQRLERWPGGGRHHRRRLRASWQAGWCEERRRCRAGALPWRAPRRGPAPSSRLRTTGRRGAITGGTNSPQARQRMWPTWRRKPCRPTIPSC